MSKSQGFRKHQNKVHYKTTQSKEIDENNPILKAFKEYSLLLDDKHDRYERIVKISRDITIESKRIIFLLHSIEARKNNLEKTLLEAQKRLKKVIQFKFKAIAVELDGQDVFQYKGAYSAGLQEFIEAYTFMEFIKYEYDMDNVKGLSDWKVLQEQMHFVLEKQKPKEKSEEDEEKKEEVLEGDEKKESVPLDKMEEDFQEAKKEEHLKMDVDEDAPKERKDEDLQGEKNSDNTDSVVERKDIKFFICPNEYILGLADLTGELMRRCVMALGSGETNTCFETCKALQQFYTGYVGLNAYRNRELYRKVNTLRASVLKTENVCYNVKVRGGEAAKWGAVFDSQPPDYVDEGFF